MTTTIDYARDYCCRGWRVIPVPAGTKAARLPGWQHLDLRPADLPHYFAAGGNISLAFGPRSGDLVDIDLDCREAVELADLFLPETNAIFGRPSKPRSHRLYISPGAAFEAFTDTLVKDTLLELRADPGHQTLVPPSVADGERRAWHGDRIAPRVLPAAELRLAVAWLAIGTLVMRHVSPYAAQRPRSDPAEPFADLPALLFDAEPILGRKAFHWLGQPAPDDPPPDAQRPRRSRRWLVTDRGDVDLDDIVDAIPNDLDWEGWNGVGMAIYAASDGSGDGRAIFDAFSRRSAKYQPTAVAERWTNYRRSPPARTGIGKLIKLAIEHGWRRGP